MKNLTALGSLVLAIMLWGCQSTNQTASRNVTSYSAEQFYKNISINGGAFSNDESKILVNSNESGIFNLYEINLKDGSKSQVTNSTVESFFGRSYVPGTNDIIYSADQGGNENSHLYLRKEDGTTQDLTPGENEKANYYGWSEDDQHMYFTSNKRDPRVFDMYKMKVGDWTPSMMFQNDGAFSIGGMSNDETQIALVKSVTTSENMLFLRDMATGQMTEISESDKKGSYSPTGFSDDGKTFYYLTNGGKDFTYLVSYDIASGDRSVLMEKAWDIMYSSLSETEKYRVTGINEDGKNTVLLHNNETNAAVDFPDMKDGDILAARISKSEKQMIMVVGSSKSSPNLYLYNFENGDLKKLTETINPELDPTDLVSAEVVRYPSFDGLDIPAIFYKPHQASAKNKVPALVWVHGGPGGQSRVGFNSQIQFLVNQGYAILAVNNRGSGGYGKAFNQMDDRNHGDKDLKDCIWGKKYLQGLDYIDGEKIGILGGSYGGFMVMAAMTNEPEAFEVGVNLFGVTNWLRTLKSIPPYWESFREALYKEMGDPFSDDSTRLYNISPVFHGAKVKNPVMVLQGSNDPRVLKVESDDMVAAIEEAGVPVEYVIFPDEGHGFVKKENQIKSSEAILAFLAKYLMGEGEGVGEADGEGQSEAYQQEGEANKEEG